jgi:hypothetical protein
MTSERNWAARVAELREVLGCPEFKAEMVQINRYAANIKPERPIVYLLAKLLRRSGNLKEVALEFRSPLDKRKTDLVLFDGQGNDCRIEVKGHWDFEIKKAKQELTRLEDEDIPPKKGHTWMVLPTVAEDLTAKSADLFVWILCCRDLTTTVNSELSAICQADGSRNYWKGQGRDWNLDRQIKQTTVDALAVLEGIVKKAETQLRTVDKRPVSVRVTSPFPAAFLFFFVTK